MARVVRMPVTTTKGSLKVAWASHRDEGTGQASGVSRETT